MKPNNNGDQSEPAVRVSLRARRQLGSCEAGSEKVMRDIAASYSIPICWIAAEDRKPVILDYGSAFLLDCGTGPFLITANHVYQGFRGAKTKHPDVVCIVGELRFDLMAARPGWANLRPDKTASPPACRTPRRTLLTFTAVLPRPTVAGSSA